jgi:outer membrane immunogenic protein
MKKILLTTVAAMAGATSSAFAADMGAPPPVKAVRAPAPLPFSWTGCYIGAHAGGGWGKTQSHSLDLTADTDGWLAGGQIGCDYQFAPNFLLGVEAMAAWTDIDGAADPFFSGKNVSRFKTQTDWIASATARAGVTADRWLIYVKGGAAWSKDDYREYGAFSPIPIVSIPFDARGSKTDSGWTWGVGIEWAFAPNWSAKLEYNQYELGEANVRLRDRFLGGTSTSRFDHDIRTIIFGVNYRFATGRP